jgi:tetratricopeptide (TPR) repeat protein
MSAPSPPPPSASFFMSYAHADGGPWLTQFYEHLSSEVRSLTPMHGECFFDRRSIEHGGSWERALEQAVSRAAVFVAIYSPAYFQSEFCGKELYLFRQRLVAARASGTLADPPLILPVLWAPEKYVRRHLPASLASIQYDHGNYPSVYATEGMLHLTRLGASHSAGKYRNEYWDFVHELAETLVDHAAAHPLPCQQHPARLTEAQNEFELCVPSLRATAVAGTAEPQRYFHVPLRRNHFFQGREGVLALLSTRFSSGRHVQALIGLGGVGKSQIAAEFAYRHRERYTAVLWTPADSAFAIALGYSRIARALELPASRSQDQSRVVKAVTDWLEANNDWLLVLDNVEDGTDVPPFLPQVMTGHVLLTSRHPALDRVTAEPIPLSPPDVEAAVSFLQARTSNVEAGSEPAAVELATELGCLPLALEQAGAYMLETQTRFAEYLEGYQRRRLRLLEAAGPVHGEYRDSVATTWTMNFEDVKRDPKSAELLNLSALLHPDDIPLELLAAAAADTDTSPPLDRLALNERLVPLYRYSLIRRSPSSSTFSIHRLVQDVLRSAFDRTELAHWQQRVVLALWRAFPTPESLYADWANCDLLVRQVQSCAAFIESAGPRGVELLTHAGFYLTECGRYEPAEGLLNRAIEAATAADDGTRVALARALDRRAWLDLKRARFGEAERRYLEGLRIREQSLNPQHMALAESWNSLGLLYDLQGRWAEAELQFQKALAALHGQGSEGSEEVGITRVNLALLYAHQERFAEAIESGRLAQQTLERHMKATHPVLATNLDNMGWFHLQARQPEVGLPLCEEALRIRQAAMDPEHPDIARSLTNIALLRLELKDDAVEALFQRALEIRRLRLPPDHPDLATSLSNLGEWLEAHGRVAEAEPLFAQAIAVRENENNPKVDE